MLAKLFGSTGFAPFRTVEDQLQGFMTFGGTTVGDRETLSDDYTAIVQRAYKQSGPVFACIMARGLTFSEARFQFQRFNQGRPGLLFGNQDLDLLEHPWTNATTGDLLWRMEQGASLAGNYFGARVDIGSRTMIRNLRPDWMTIITGVREHPEESPYALDAEILAYIYAPEGSHVPDPVLLLPQDVIHYAPIPDPEAQWRGMSWITPLIDEIQGDRWAQKHKVKFFENGTMGGLVVTYDGTRDPEKLKQFKKIFDESYAGADNAYRVLHMGGGADIKALAANMQQLDFRALSGSAETRIAAAAGVGSIIARFSEGMAGSSLNSGNYNSAKRQYADMTLRPLWRMAAAALDKPRIVVVPAGARLWYDDRDIKFLQEDAKDAAEIQSVKAQTMKALIDSGFEPDKVVEAVEADDLQQLKGTHSGLFSVQLQPPGSVTPAPATGTPPAINPPGPVPELPVGAAT